MIWAFRLFLFAVMFYLPRPCSGHGHYPKAFSLVFIGFAVLLAGYLWAAHRRALAPVVTRAG